MQSLSGTGIADIYDAPIRAFHPRRRSEYDIRAGRIYPGTTSLWETVS
jgi:hypothetical protein